VSTGAARDTHLAGRLGLEERGHVERLHEFCDRHIVHVSGGEGGLLLKVVEQRCGGARGALWGVAGGRAEAGREGCSALVAVHLEDQHVVEIGEIAGGCTFDQRVVTLLERLLQPGAQAVLGALRHQLWLGEHSLHQVGAPPAHDQLQQPAAQDRVGPPIVTVHDALLGRARC
jgi:hypothetical protein